MVNRFILSVLPLIFPLHVSENCRKCIISIVVTSQLSFRKVEKAPQLFRQRHHPLAHIFIISASSEITLSTPPSSDQHLHHLCIFPIPLCQQPQLHHLSGLPPKFTSISTISAPDSPFYTESNRSSPSSDSDDIDASEGVVDAAANAANSSPSNG